MPLTDYNKTGYPIYDIDLDAPSEERWAELCRAESDNIQALMQEVLDFYQCQYDLAAFQNKYLPKPLQKIFGSGKLVENIASWSGSLVGAIARLYGQEYAREIKGIARATSLPAGLLILANMIYDLSQTAEARGIGCSSFSFNLRGAPVLARNMDWTVPETTGKYTRLVRFHEGKSHYESVGILGCVGVLSAMAPGKWAMTLNQAPTGKIRPAVTQWPGMHRIRAVCDTFGSYRTVVSQLQAYQTHAPFLMHVVGTKPEEHCGISGLVSSYQKRTKGREKALIQTNHYTEENLAEHNPVEEEDADYYYDTYERYDFLAEQLVKPPASLKGAMHLLNQDPVYNSRTQHSMLFCPKTGSSRVSLRLT